MSLDSRRIESSHRCSILFFFIFLFLFFLLPLGDCLSGRHTHARARPSALYWRSMPPLAEKKRECGALIIRGHHTLGCRLAERDALRVLHASNVHRRADDVGDDAAVRLSYKSTGRLHYHEKERAMPYFKQINLYGRF